MNNEEQENQADYQSAQDNGDRKLETLKGKFKEAFKIKFYGYEFIAVVKKDTKSVTLICPEEFDKLPIETRELILSKIFEIKEYPKDNESSFEEIYAMYPDDLCNVLELNDEPGTYRENKEIKFKVG
jgi:hypothetical protein